jgi:hypothetical protein
MMAVSVTSTPSGSETLVSLDLSGEKLRSAAEGLVHACEQVGGVERLAAAVRLKSEAFQERLASGAAERLELMAFDELVPLMATVRARIGKLIEQKGWVTVRSAIVELLADAHTAGTGDACVSRFCKHFPVGKETRFVRDFASELLHNVYPELYPLMNRWVWDAKVNTGVLREIWHGDNVDNILIDVPDNHATFLTLREELSQFLSNNGVFRDMLWYVDLLCAQIYGDYINAQGGAYLRSDFSSAPNLLEQTRRILGLDRVNRSAGGGTIIDGVMQPMAIKHIH